MLKVSMVSFQQRHVNKQERKGDDAIHKAMIELKKLELAPHDYAKMQKIGIKPPFASGKAAYEYIKNQNVRVRFAKLYSPLIHAQWDYNSRSIMLNDIYKKTTDKAVILALSEAIFHEAGHAKDMDSASSLQEELDCLALNAMAHRTHELKYPNTFSNSKENIVKNGVNLYAELFFPPETSLQSAEPQAEQIYSPYDALVSRMRTTYTDLPAGDFLHPPCKLALKIKKF